MAYSNNNVLYNKKLNPPLSKCYTEARVVDKWLKKKDRSRERLDLMETCVNETHTELYLYTKNTLSLPSTSVVFTAG